MDENKNEIKCFECKKDIQGKPWIILKTNEDCNIFGCSYKCSKNLDKFMGGSYWQYVVNKDDFTKDPIPYPFSKNFDKVDICFNDFELNEIRYEIECEEKRIREIEEETYSEEYENNQDDY